MYLINNDPATARYVRHWGFARGIGFHISRPFLQTTEYWKYIEICLRVEFLNPRDELRYAEELKAACRDIPILSYRPLFGPYDVPEELREEYFRYRDKDPLIYSEDLSLQKINS